MEYNKLTFYTDDSLLKEILVAKLDAAGFEGFEEKDDSLDAYIPADAYTETDVKAIAGEHGLKYDVVAIAQQNWNEEWERNFQPVIVEGFCTVRADFHTLKVDTPYEIIITPKMSFGTGHHATTRLVMTEMKALDFIGKKVFDFGTGTGILAILAEKLGAAQVLGIDNDEWSYENGVENIGRNATQYITIKQGTIEDVASDSSYDVILANINRHILLQYMKDMYNLLVPGGKILMSGLLTEDKDIILNAAAEAGFIYRKDSMLNNWIVLLFER